MEVSYENHAYDLITGWCRCNDELVLEAAGSRLEAAKADIKTIMELGF